MPGAHRQDDTRFCGALTVVTNQSTVTVEDKLWSVEGDQNSHTGGNLRAVYGDKNVYIEDKLVIVSQGDEALPDSIHPEPDTWPNSSSGTVSAY